MLLTVIRRPTASRCAPSACALLALAALAGCGTTRWSDTIRTGTEQLLVSDAIDRAVSQIDFSLLAGQKVYLDNRYIAATVDQTYVTSSLRQHMIASGCIVKDKPEDATFICELRTGAVGTNRADLLFGVPATNLPGGGGAFPVAPTAIPELPLVKRTTQQGVCKMAVFAYERETGLPVWQSGMQQVASRAKDVWVFGAGPFQQGSIYEGTKFAGEKLKVPLTRDKPSQPDKVWVTHEFMFRTPEQLAQAKAEADKKPAADQQAKASTPPPAALPAPPPLPPPPQTISNTPNMVGGAVGAVQAFDWMRSMRGGEAQQAGSWGSFFK